MSLKQTITDDVKDAMRAKDKQRLATLRLITAAIKQIEVDKRIDLDDSQIIDVLTKMLKQRRESIEQFSSAGRDDLVKIEEYEVGVIQPYMPEALSETQIDKLIADAIAKTGAESMKDMGKVMGILKPQMAGRADMSAVSKQIRSKLD